MDETDILVQSELKMKGHGNRRGNQDTCANSENMLKLDNIKNQMAYHTIHSKSICEKRDLNNIPLQSNDSEQLVSPYKSHYFPQNKDAFDSVSKISTMNEGNKNLCYFDRKDLASSSNTNGEMWERKEITSNLSSKVNRNEIRKSNFLLRVCKINFNVFLCWISLFVCIYCLYSTINLKLHFKVNISNFFEL